MKVLLDKANIEGIRFYEAYRKNGGYAAVEKAFKTSPAEIVCHATLFVTPMKVSLELLKTGI